MDRQRNRVRPVPNQFNDRLEHTGHQREQREPNLQRHILQVDSRHHSGGNRLLKDGVVTLVSETETTNEYQEYTADLSAYSGKGFIAIRHFNCQDEFYLVLDDFGIYDENAGDPWTTVSDASPAGTTLEGLTSDTEYDYQVGYQYGGKTYYTSTATLTTLPADVAPTDLHTTTISANTATLSWTGYGDSYNLRYSQGGTAKVTLYVPNDIWEDGTGYQMLLDKDHNTYGSVIPESGGLTGSGDASPETYDNFEYKIPENADGALNTSNVVDGTNVTELTITILAGTYDWCITNPSPGDRMWIASENGNVGGRQNDFVFEAGNFLHFERPHRHDRLYRLRAVRERQQDLRMEQHTLHHA